MNYGAGHLQKMENVLPKWQENENPIDPESC